MKILSLLGGLVAFQAVVAPTLAADDSGITRLATCQDSWLDWQKTDPAKLQKFAVYFRTEFSQHDNDPFVVPKAPVSVAGLHVSQVFPGSVGMGVGFSITVDAPFEKTRAVVEKMVGKSLGKCETSDGMHSCELEIAEQRTLVLMSGDDPKSAQTLLGCYYYYEK